MKIGTMIQHDDGTDEHIGIAIEPTTNENVEFIRAEVIRANLSLRDALLARGVALSSVEGKRS